MCAVSMVLQHGMDTFKMVHTWPAVPQTAYWKQWQELVEKARKYDELMAQPDCEDPEKAKFEDKIIKRLEELEKKVAMY